MSRAIRTGLLAAALALSLLALPPSLLAQSDAAHQQFLFAYKLLQRGDNRLAADAFDDYLARFPGDEKRGDALYYRALLHRRGGQNQEAAEVLADAPAPELVPPYAVDLLRGQVLHDLKRHAEAVRALERVDAASLDAQTAASTLYLRGLAQRGAGNLAAAANDLVAAAERETPLRAQALVDLARVQLLADRPDEAMATLDRAIGAGNSGVAAEAARLAGDIAYNRGRYDDAVAAYRKVATDHPGSPHFGPAVVGTLWAHYSAGRYPQVMEAFERYEASLPVEDRVTAFYLAGSAQQELGRHEQAVRYLEQVTQEGVPQETQEKAFYKLAASQLQLGRYDAMNGTIQRLTTRFPESELRVDAAFLLAAAEAKQGDVAKGAARLTRIIDQGPQSGYYLPALLRRANLYEEAGEYENAATDYRRYLDQSGLAPMDQEEGGAAHQPTATQAGAFLRLLGVYSRLGQHDRGATLAQAWLDRMRLAPAQEQEALYRLALARVGQNQPREALDALDELERRHPENAFAAEAAYYRGLLLLSLEQPDEALPLLERSAAREELARPLRVNALRLVAIHHRDAGQSVEAAAALRRIETIAGREALTEDELLFLARHYLPTDAPAALAYATPLVEGRPNAAPGARAEAVYLAGRAAQALGQYDEAERAFGQVVAMGQGFDLESRLELARVAMERGRYRQALGELTGLINSESSAIAAEALALSARIHRHLAADARRAGNAAQQAEANQEAQRLLKRLVLLYPFRQLEPLPQLAYLDLAEIAADLGEPQDVVHDELEELVSKYPDGPYATYARAVIAADNSRLGDAVALLRSLQDEPLDERLAVRVEALLKLLEPGA